MGRVPPAGCGAILKGARTTPGNRYTYAIYLDDDLTSSEGGREIISLPMRGVFEKNN